MQKIKKRVFEIIQIGNKADTASKIFDYAIIILIISNILVTFLLSFEGLSDFFPVFRTIESISLIIFLIEYILRIWTAEYLYPDKSRLRSTLKFLVSFYGLVDIFTLAPYFLPFAFPSGAIAFRMFRVVRILRLFKITASYDAFNVIIDVIKEKKDQLISSMFLIFILLIAASFCMYGVENEVQPDKFANAFSGIWWAVSALLTVGYGDIYPITTLGRILAIIISFLGVLIAAIPTGIISAGFVEYYSKAKKEQLKASENIVFITIYLNHEFCQQRIRDVKLPEGLSICQLERKNKKISFTGETLIKENDVLGIKSFV